VLDAESPIGKRDQLGQRITQLHAEIKYLADRGAFRAATPDGRRSDRPLRVPPQHDVQLRVGMPMYCSACHNQRLGVRV
jgi:hypothetical protein